MSSIPLPALDVKPTAQPDILQNYTRLAQLQNLQQEQQQRVQEQPYRQQIMQNEAATGAVDLQAKQIALRDQQAMDAAMKEWGQPKATQPASSPTGQPGSSPASSSASSTLPDYGDLIGLARKNGASFNAIKGLQTSILDMQSKASTIVMNDARTGASNATAMKEKNGMISDAINSTINAPDDQLSQQILQTANELAQKGLMDPQHVQMAQQIAALGDPAQMRQRLTIYANSLGGFSKMVDDAQKKLVLDQTKGKSDPASPFYAPSDKAVAMGTAPGAAQIQAGEVKQAGAKAGAEAAARQPYEMALARQRQALSQGDPEAAGQLLVNHDATLSELKSRGATPDFIAKALFAAHRLSGGKYNSQEADAQFSVAKSPANVAFFGSAKSLTDKGGTLDQLAAAAKDIPGGQIPVFNSIADAEKAATGSGPIAKYASILLGVSDDYSKVMGGGQGSDSSRAQALKLVPANASPEARAAAIEGIRGAVGSQLNSRIGNNPVLGRMYGGGLSGTAGAPASGNDPFSQFGGKAH